MAHNGFPRGDSTQNILEGSQDALFNSESYNGIPDAQPQLGWRPLPMVQPSPRNHGPARSGPSDPLSDMSGNFSPTGDISMASTMSSNLPPPSLSRVPTAIHSFRCPVASDVLKLVDGQYRNVDEFRYMTYTPVLCEPEDFAVPENQYSLRQMRMRRRTELLIAITMYNESDEFLIRTLSAVFKNIRFFCELNSGERIGARRDSTKGALIGKLNDETFVASKSRTNPDLEAGVRGDQMWDEDAWQKIVVVIISDGRTKVHPRVMKMLQVMGVVQPEVMLMESTDPLEEPPNNPKKPVQAHLFETTCQAIVEEDLMVKSGSKNGVVPVQMLFCLKEKNKKKLNSHKWLFRAFCPLLNPNTIVLIDVGTRPKTLNSIYHLWKAFDRDENIAGACGEICVMLGKGCDNCKSVTSPLTAAQNFEYKISNILDKTLESCFGYISVLPGAFSAYRWEALQDTTSESGPLVQYFKGETPKPKGNVFSSNMYLAEDRILCFELVAKYNAKWVLHYVKDARAETDVPGSVHEFISQRRRWLNGTFFCQIYALFHLHRLWTTRHSIFKKLAFMFQFLYFTISLIFSWFAIANFYLAFYLITRQTLDPNIFWQELIFQVVRLFYWAIIIAQFICSMGNRPQGARFIYVGSFVIFGLIMMFLTGVSVYLMVQIFSNLNGTSWLLGGTATTLVISIGSTYGVYIISSLLFGEAYHILSCMFQYLTLLPSFINTIQIYAFCNTHDVSWGTKGDTAASTGLEKKEGQKADLSGDKKPVSTEPAQLPPEALSLSYRKAWEEMAHRPEEQVAKIDAGQRREDYYRNFRTWFVLLWVMTNGLLIAVVSSETISSLLISGGSSGNSNAYLAFIMYAVAGFAIIRFLGCVLYLIMRAARAY